MPVDEVTELRKLWRKRKPFLMQMEVSTPYSGCWVEPNIFLVTPPGSAMQEELMADIPSRYGSKRERLCKAEREAYQNQQRAISNFDWIWRETRGDGFRLERPTLEELVILFDEMDKCQYAYIDAECDYEAAKAADLTPMEQPQLYVWPLYASGQGAAMDCIHSLRDLVSVCKEESVFSLANQDTWPDGLLGSRFATGSQSYGRITLVQVAELGPINDALPAAERYWMHALKVADEQWGVQLSWSCSGCNQTIEYSEYEGRPEPTGSGGDGGVGIHYYDVLCDECLQEGACDHCRENSGNPMEYYDRDIAEYGWSLCEYCTEQLLDTCDLTGEVDDLPSTVELQWWKDPKQPSLPGVEVPPKLTFLVDDKPIQELKFNASALASTASDMGIEHLHPEYGYGGVALSGTVVENVAFKRV